MAVSKLTARLEYDRGFYDGAPATATIDIHETFVPEGDTRPMYVDRHSPICSIVFMAYERRDGQDAAVRQPFKDRENRITVERWHSPRIRGDYHPADAVSYARDAAKIIKHLIEIIEKHNLAYVPRYDQPGVWMEAISISRRISFGMDHKGYVLDCTGFDAHSKAQY